jgi:hypothetical protein
MENIGTVVAIVRVKGERTMWRLWVIVLVTPVVGEEGFLVERM